MKCTCNRAHSVCNISVSRLWLPHSGRAHRKRARTCASHCAQELRLASESVLCVGPKGTGRGPRGHRKGMTVAGPEAQVTRRCAPMRGASPLPSRCRTHPPPFAIARQGPAHGRHGTRGCRPTPYAVRPSRAETRSRGLAMLHSGPAVR